MSYQWGMRKLLGHVSTNDKELYIKGLRVTGWGSDGRFPVYGKYTSGPVGVGEPGGILDQIVIEFGEPTESDEEGICSECGDTFKVCCYDRYCDTCGDDLG